MRHPEFPVISFLCIILLLSSLPSHIRAGSVSTMALIAWMGIMNLIRGVNSLIWAGNVDLKLEVWCDITTKITVGFTFAVPAAALCILRHLESVSSTRHARTTKADKRKRQRFEGVMCFGVPVLFMALHYIVQGHRFDLFEDFGCAPTVYVSVAGLCLVYIPPIILSLASFVYAALALHHFLRHRIEFASHLQKTHAAISPGRYFRLMALAITEMVWDTGVNAYIIYFNTFTGLRPWISWANVHSDFSRVQLLPEFLIPPDLKSQLVFQWWILPVSCICFFIFFGFGEEAMSDYRAVFRWFRRSILRQHIDWPPFYSSATVLPSYRPHVPHVNVEFPRRSNDVSGNNAKAWGGSSLNTSEGKEPSASPTSRVSKATLSFPRQDELPTFIVVSDLPSSTMEVPQAPPSSSDNKNHPDEQDAVLAFMITRPSNVVLHHDVSAASLSATCRKSMSTDFGITISPAYFPEADTASRFHEAFPTRDSQESQPASDHPHGGIHITIEKSVI